MTRLLKEKLASTFDQIETFDFPHYESVAGGLVGRILNSKTVVVQREKTERGWLNLSSGNRSPDHALLLQCAMIVNRLEYLDVIEGFEDDGDCLLILDRYYLSGIVYGQADGLDREWLYKVHASLPEPDLFFVLDIPVEESVRRRPERRDYYEKNLEKLERVRALYLDEASTDPGGTIVVDATRSPEEVANVIAAHIVRAR